MASIIQRPNGHKWVQFVSPNRKRKTVRLGKCSNKVADTVRHRVECLLSSLITGTLDRDTSLWVADMTERNPDLRSKLEAVGLLEPLDPDDSNVETVEAHLADFIERVGAHRKPGTVAVWKQVQRELNRELPKGIMLSEVTRGHAKAFHDQLKKRGLASLTVVKHVRIAKQMFEDAVEWEKIPQNPFAKIKASASIPKNNVEVTRETIKKLYEHLDPTWKAIVGLSRYAGLRCPSETLSLKWGDVDFEKSLLHIPVPKLEHHEGRAVRECPLFPEVREVLEALFNEATEELGHYPKPESFVIDKQAYRNAANTGSGWKNANLRTQLLKRLEKARITPWARLFHSMRASRQTELERQFPIHVVCSWLGNSPKVAQRSYLLVTEADIAKAIRPEVKPEAVKNVPQSESQGKPEAFCEAVTGGNGGYPRELNREKHWGFKHFPLKKKRKSTDGEGFEPTVALRLLRFSRPVH